MIIGSPQLFRFDLFQNRSDSLPIIDPLFCVHLYEFLCSKGTTQLYRHRRGKSMKHSTVYALSHAFGRSGSLGVSEEALTESQSLQISLISLQFYEVRNWMGTFKMFISWLVKTEVLKSLPVCLQLGKKDYTFPKERRKGKGKTCRSPGYTALYLDFRPQNATLTDGYDSSRKIWKTNYDPILKSAAEWYRSSLKTKRPGPF